MSKPKAAKSNESPARRTRVKSEFPKDPLEKALRVARALEDSNGGQPLPPIDTATAMGVSPGSSDFRQILSSSLKYGLTAGSYKSDYVSLEQLGENIVEPKSPEEAADSLVKAALGPKTFADIYSYLKGKKLPEPSFFQNTIAREFDVPKEHAQLCVEIFLANVKFAGLVRETKSGTWLSKEQEPRKEQVSPETLPSTESESDEHERSPNGEVAEASGSIENTGDHAPNARRTTGAERKVFITHGKDKSFVEPIKKLLQFGELIPVVSVEKQSVSKPVPEKVMDEMRSCGAAIIHVDAEQRLIDAAAQEHVVINPNVLIEIGAAMALYGRRFILLVRQGVSLPSNLQGLYEVRYSSESLDGEATIRLLEAINDIKKNPLPE